MNDHQPPLPMELSVRRMLGDIKEFACREPAKAAAAAIGVGLLINLLPARAMVATTAAVGAVLLRPVLLSLGATKAMELCCQKTSTHLNS